MKKVLLSIFVLFILFSCNKTTIKKIEIDFITLSVLNSKNENHPLNLFLDIKSKRILIYNNKIHFLELPPQPNGSTSNSVRIEQKIDNEIIELSSQEIDNIKNILSEFTEDDFESKKQTSYDGLALKLNFTYNDNSFKTIELINNSTKRQTEFFKVLFQVLYDKSSQQAILNEYYNKEYL